MDAWPMAAFTERGCKRRVWGKEDQSSVRPFGFEVIVGDHTSWVPAVEDIWSGDRCLGAIHMKQLIEALITK